MSEHLESCPKCSKQGSYLALAPVSNTHYVVKWHCDACESEWSQESHIGPLADLKGKCLVCAGDWTAAGACEVCGIDENGHPEYFGWEELEKQRPLGNAKVAFAKGLFRKGLGLLNFGLRQEYGQVEAWEMKYDFLRRIGRENVAVEMLENAIRAGAPLSLQQLVGDYYLQNGQYLDAVAALTSQLESLDGLTEGHAELISNLALALHGAGELDDAEKAYRTALELAPLNPRIGQNFVAFLLEEGREDEAGPICEQALLVASDDATRADLLVLQSYIYAAAGDLDVALSTLKLAESMGHQSEDSVNLTRAIMSAMEQENRE